MTTLARDWHALSDHAADGAPFGSPICNCERQAERVQVLITAERNRLADEIETTPAEEWPIDELMGGETPDEQRGYYMGANQAIAAVAAIVRAHNP